MELASMQGLDKQLQVCLKIPTLLDHVGLPCLSLSMSEAKIKTRSVSVSRKL